MDADWPPPWRAVGRQLKRTVGELQRTLEIEEDAGRLTERQSKRMDKSLVLLKAGFKMAKKALKKDAHTKRGAVTMRGPT